MFGIDEVVPEALPGPLKLETGAGEAIPLGWGAQAAGKIATATISIESVDLRYIARPFGFCAAQSAMSMKRSQALKCSAWTCFVMKVSCL